MEAAIGQMLAIRTDLDSPAGLRHRAKKEPNRRAALRMLAIVSALEGMSRADAARVVAIERQSLCDALKRFNAEGLTGLYDRPKGHRRPVLSEGEEAALFARTLRGPDPEKGEPSSWTLPDLCHFSEERFSQHMGPQSLSRVVRRLGLPRQKARPVHPQRNAKAVEAFEKGGSVSRRSGRCHPSRQAHRALVPGRSARRAERLDRAPLVDQGRAGAGLV
jgi:transposase